MLAGDWGVVDAADGFMLLHKGAPEKSLPAEFYDFARTSTVADAIHDAPLRFIGATADDWPRWRQSTVTTRWQVGEGFDAATMSPQIELRSPTGETLYRFADANPPARVWYPPERWQAGDEVVITTLPLHLPRDWGVAVEQTPGLTVLDSVAASAVDESALVAAYRRGEDGALYDVPPELFGISEWIDWFEREMGERLTTTEAVLRMPNGEGLALRAQLQDRTYWPGDVVDLWVTWAGDSWPEGVTVFAHLRADGENVDQSDGTPRYFVKYDAQKVLGQFGIASDWRQLVIPTDAEAGESANATWTVVMGLYDPASGERAELFGPDGKSLGDELVVGQLKVEAPPTPDQSCALIPATCASQRQ